MKREIKKVFFNIYEFENVKKACFKNPYNSLSLFGEYFNKYPYDYTSYPYYINVLIRLNHLEEASKIYNKAMHLFKQNPSFSCFEKRNNKFRFDMLHCKLRLLSFQNKYQEMFYLLINNMDCFSKEEASILLLYCKRKLNYLNNNRDKPNFEYLKSQIYDYQEERFLEHIKKHLYDTGTGDDNTIFNKDFPLDKVIDELKKIIPSDKKICKDYIINIYNFKYNGCGRCKGRLLDYFVVVTFNDSQEFISMYPVETSKYETIDFNYLNEKEDVKVKKISQIDKFNKRYNR